MPVRTSIRDIARVAGVSVGTASNVINGKPGHSVATRERVLAAAAQLNFTPNALIRSLQQGRTNTIGVLTWRLPRIWEDGIGVRLLYGITEGLAAVRYDSLLYSGNPQSGYMVEPSVFLDGRVDGAIIAISGMRPEDYGALAKAQLPAVIMYDKNVPPGIGSVGIDNKMGIDLVVDHLTDLGHRRIAYIGPSFTPDYVDRRDAYRSALMRHGIDYDPALDIGVVADYRASLQATADLVTSISPLPTALIMSDDHMAIYLGPVLKERGIRIPEDLSVTGFDDTMTAQHLLDLTSVRQPADEVGWLAAEFVAAMIRGKPAEECRAILPVELMARGSTARPRG